MMIIREVSLSRSILIIYIFISTPNYRVKVFSILILYIFINKHTNVVKTLIYAGNAGIQLANNIKTNSKYKLIGFIDDDPKKNNIDILSKNIFNRSKIESVIKLKQIDLILLAIPSLSNDKKKEILKYISQFPVNVMVLPSIENIIDGKVTINNVKRVKVEQVLGREPIKPIDKLLNKNIKNKVVLVTGAGGSIGQEL